MINVKGYLISEDNVLPEYLSLYQELCKAVMLKIVEMICIFLRHKKVISEHDHDWSSGKLAKLALLVLYKSYYGWT